jgi:hypothetical protein
MAHQPPTRPITAPIMTPFFNLPIGPSGHSVRHGKTRSPKADLTTLLKMRRATQVHHEHARLSDRANVSHVRLPVRQQNFDFREGVGRPARPHGALELGRRRHPTKMSRSTLHRSRPLSALDRTPDGAGAPRDQAPRRDRACRTSAARFVALKKMVAWSVGCSSAFSKGTDRGDSSFHQQLFDPLVELFERDCAFDPLGIDEEGRRRIDLQHLVRELFIGG